MDRETGPMTEGEDTQRGHQEESTSGCHEDSSQVFHQATGTGGLATVEVLAPAEAEEIVPWQHLGERPR
jgi:hypothetical protein